MTIHESTTTLRTPLPALRRALMGVGLLSLATSASAGTVTGGAFIDWSTLNIQFVQGEGSVVIDAPYTYVTGDSFFDFPFDSTSDWTTSVSLTVPVPNSQNLASGDAGSLLTAASLDTTTNGYYVSITAARGANLNIVGDGILLVSVAATVGADTSSVDPTFEYGYSDSSARVALSNGALFSRSSIFATAELGEFFTNFDLQSGLLTAALSVHDGDQIQLDFSTTTYLEAGQYVSSVPIPASLPLLGTALLGLASIKRARRSRDAAPSEA